MWTFFQLWFFKNLYARVMALGSFFSNRIEQMIFSAQLYRFTFCKIFISQNHQMLLRCGKDRAIYLTEAVQLANNNAIYPGEYFR